MRQVTVVKTVIVRSVATIEVPDQQSDEDVERELYKTGGRGENWEELSEASPFFEFVRSSYDENR